MGKLVHKAELSELIGRSQQTISAWQKAGMPVQYGKGRGNKNFYDIEKVVDWLVERKIGHMSSDENGEYHSLEAERARLTFHQANKTALEEDVLKGRLITAEEVLDTWSAKVSAFRAKMLSLPTKTAHLLLNIQDFEEVDAILKAHIYEALQELSESNESYSENQPVGEQSRGSTAQLNS